MISQEYGLFGNIKAGMRKRYKCHAVLVQKYFPSWCSWAASRSCRWHMEKHLWLLHSLWIGLGRCLVEQLLVEAISVVTELMCIYSRCASLTKNNCCQSALLLVCFALCSIQGFILPWMNTITGRERCWLLGKALFITEKGTSSL